MSPLVPGFDERVIHCGTRQEAEAEAARQQADDPAAVWIYVRDNGQWAAKRTPTNRDIAAAEAAAAAAAPPRSRLRKFGSDLVSALLNGPSGLGS